MRKKPNLYDVKKLMANYIVYQKGYKPETAQWMAERIEKLVNYMHYGHAVIAFRKQQGGFALVRATLVGYERAFGRAYNLHRLTRGTMVFWSEEAWGWRTLQIDNFIEWRPVV